LIMFAPLEEDGAEFMRGDPWLSGPEKLDSILSAPYSLSNFRGGRNKRTQRKPRALVVKFDCC
jgi:hypothetical protein